VIDPGSLAKVRMYKQQQKAMAPAVVAPRPLRHVRNG
jgi:hypothetical protein